MRDKVVVITGASAGIGAALAERLGREGGPRVRRGEPEGGGELEEAEGRIQILIERAGGKLKAQDLAVEVEDEEIFDADEGEDEE